MQAVGLRVAHQLVLVVAVVLALLALQGQLLAVAVLEVLVLFHLYLAHKFNMLAVVAVGLFLALALHHSLGAWVLLAVVMVAVKMLELLFTTHPKQAWLILAVVEAVRVMHKRVLLADQA
jgi:hypothetical protein